MSKIKNYPLKKPAHGPEELWRQVLKKAKTFVFDSDLPCQDINVNLTASSKVPYGHRWPFWNPYWPHSVWAC